MTSRPVSDSGATSTTPGAAPGDRPHLPPVATTSRRTDRKAPMAWLPWLLLGLLLLTLLLAALLAKAAGSGSDDTARSESGSGTSQDSGASGSGSGSGAESGAALSAGGQDLLTVEGSRIGSLDGQSAQGTAQVESVVADEGFWVGTGPDSRVFVFLTPEARRSAGESGFQVEAGQTVSLEGTIKKSSAEFASSIGVSADEGARQLVEQGGYVEATEVRLAG